MLLTEEIDDLYLQYVLMDKDMKKLVQTSKKTPQTLKKYITLKEQLDIELYPLLDNRKELTQDIALTLCKEVPNPNIQIQIFPLLQGLSTKDKKLKIIESKQCDICADSKHFKEVLPCCGNVLCFDCIVSIIEASINGISFQKICCPYCREDIVRGGFLRDMFRLRRLLNPSPFDPKHPWMSGSFESWKNSDNYITYMRKYGYFYLHNLFRKYRRIKQSLVKEEVTMETHHFGYCRTCIKDTYGTNEDFMKKHNYRIIMHIDKLNIAKVPKDCAQDIELNESMFICEPCSNKDKVEIKSCPHCGIKSIKPIDCNYVKCQCGNFWCFVCNVRLPGTREGHNNHFWLGNGTSAYDNNCRITIGYPGEPHILQSCNCSYCSKREGAPMCMNINCLRKTHPRKDYIVDKKRLQYEQYCFVCK